MGVRYTHYKDNRIETSKYNLLSFLPKNLYVQMSKIAHLYFVVIGICQTFQKISTTNGQPLVLFPLLLIVSISMVKDFIEDRRRHAADMKDNMAITSKLDIPSREFVKVAWKDLRVGDIVQVKQNDPFPADLLLFHSTSRGVKSRKRLQVDCDVEG